MGNKETVLKGEVVVEFLMVEKDQHMLNSHGAPPTQLSVLKWIPAFISAYKNQNFIGYLYQ